jgi:hypothetical protein
MKNTGHWKDEESWVDFQRDEHASSCKSAGVVTSELSNIKVYCHVGAARLRNLFVKTKTQH